MLSGLVISALCGDVNTALQVSVATFYPVLVLSGEWINTIEIPDSY